MTLDILTGLFVVLWPFALLAVAGVASLILWIKR